MPYTVAACRTHYACYLILNPKGDAIAHTFDEAKAQARVNTLNEETSHAPNL